MTRIRAGLLAPAGLIVGPALWAANTQLGQVIPYAACGLPFHPVAFVAFAAAGLSLAAGWLSWRASRAETEPRARHSVYPASFSFVGRLAALAGIVFTYALVLQGLSAAILSGCER